MNIAVNKPRYKVAEFKWQVGSAITLPMFFSVPVVFTKSKAQWYSDGKLRKHELTHVEQIYRYGKARYLFFHLWGRIKARNIWGIGHWIEDDAYAAEEK